MRTIFELEPYLSLDASQLADTVLHCPVCGRDHQIPFQIVRAGQGLVTTLPQVIEGLSGTMPARIGVLYDRQIEDKLEKLFFEPLDQAGIACQRLPLGEKGWLLEASVELGDATVATLPDGIDFLMGVGSGVISDLTKWTATRKALPFLLFGTAASMNAYTSITGSMTENNVKTSKWLNPANAVLLDSDLLASAPSEMTGAGVGDLLARNVANADWKLSELLRQTYFCPVPFELMTSYQARLLPLMEALGRNDTAAMRALAEAVLVSGYSMTVLDGQTSPSSGSEHILSHFFDFQHQVFDLPKNLHGAQVGVGTLIMSTAFEMLREMDPAEFDPQALARNRATLETISADHARIFGDHGRIFDTVAAGKHIPDADYRQYVQGVLQSWDDLWEAIDPYLMPPREIRVAMEAAGAVTTLSGLYRTREDALQALLYGSHYRPRYTILDLFWELGLFPDLAPEILACAGVLD